MKIVEKSPPGQTGSWSFWLLLVAGSLLVGILLGSAGSVNSLQSKWQALWRTMTGPASSTDLPLLLTDIDFESYNLLLEQRQSALDQGVLYQEDVPFVAAEVQEGNTTVPVWIRLLPGKAAHLGADDKWNFELQVRNDAALAGLTHANLIDPNDNAWLNEWAFLKALRNEGLPTADYQFVHLILNGDDKGIYALQEVPEPLLLREGEEGSIVVSYDPNPLLEAISYFGDLDSAVADPVSNLAGNDLRFLQVAPIDDPLVTDNQLLSAQADRATALLRGLQNGDLQASEVFDAEQYGRFLALTDLWAANDTLSPLNLQYTYNRKSDRLEPIAANAKPLQSAARIPLDSLYQDPRIQAAYAAALVEYSDPAYLANLRATIEAEYDGIAGALPLQANAASLWDNLTARQSQLRLSLQPTQPVIAQLGPPELAQEAIIRVNVANALNLPLEVLGFDIDGATFMESDPGWITAGQANVQINGQSVILRPVSGVNGLQFVTFDLPLTEIIQQDQELDFLHEIEIQVATRILGLEATQLTPASPGLRKSS